MEFYILIAIIVLAAAFDFINGFHDAANSIATVVTTRVLTPTQAVLWAAGFNFVAFFIAKFIIGEFGVADTVAKIVVPGEGINILVIILIGLLASIIWNLITWWFGIPSSSSHTLIGSLSGAAIAAAGLDAVHIDTVLVIAAFIFVAPLIGMVGGFIITLITMYVSKWVKVKPHQADNWFKLFQLVSSAFLSITHGLNDSQKEIGVISCALIAYTVANPGDLPEWMAMTEFTTEQVHDWIPILCFTAIAVGTMSGGWKIMKTMGNKITKIAPMEGFCAQAAGSITLFITESLHIPVSTTHVISGSIMGVGATKRTSAVRWGVTIDLLTAWLLTIPVSATLAALLYFLLHGLF
ncbi:MAG: inorganic phosphate transporter [Paludibacteraceae bacterium]|nr:inorganic phosphate transporter [Candidatus Physcocola equi]MCQ2233256.1 inorganic phosphate transporter [Paludibacteraceae bacterium]